VAHVSLPQQQHPHTLTCVAPKPTAAFCRVTSLTSPNLMLTWQPGVCQPQRRHRALPKVGRSRGEHACRGVLTPQNFNSNSNCTLSTSSMCALMAAQLVCSQACILGGLTAFGQEQLVVPVFRNMFLASREAFKPNPASCQRVLCKRSRQRTTLSRVNCLMWYILQGCERCCRASTIKHRPVGVPAAWLSCSCEVC
jgi:hypothetical protein